MSDSNLEPLRRVLIASANPLFARGLQKLTATHWAGRPVEVRLASSMEEASAILETWSPHLVIVDYDDAERQGGIQRDVFLSRFMAEKRPMQIMLVSLRSSGEVVVYDRRTLTPAQAEDWLDLPWTNTSEAETGAKASPAPFVPQAAPQSAGASNLVAVTPTGTRSGGMKHFVIAGFLTVILTLITGWALTAVGLMPVEAASQAVPIDSMISLQVWMIAFLFSLIVVFMLYSLIVFRRRSATSYGAYFKSSTSLEIAWTLVPLATVIFLSFLGARDLSEVRRVDPNALEVNVTAFQWGWAFDYPDTGIKSNVLYLPVNRQVHLVMTSRDVIHSFWVPEFRVKQDVLPGKNLVKDLRITPNRIGDYKVRCAELCGGAHALMESPVKVVSQQDYDTWVATQSDTSSMNPAERGARLTNACIGCHSTDGSAKVGPTWKGLAGSQVTLADGSTVTADDAYLTDSIINPDHQIVKGSPPGVMPKTYKADFTDQQIQDIVAFIKTLK